MSKGAQIAVGATLIALLLGWYGFTNLGADATFQYYQTLDEMISQQKTDPASFDERALRIHAYVSVDSIERDIAAKHVRFAIQNEPPHAGGSSSDGLEVIYLGLETPDLFKDGAEVVVEGRLDASEDGSVFLADNVLAKCPSKFEAKAAAETAPPGRGAAL